VTSGNGTNPARHKSKRPYRDSALAYAGLGALVAVIAYASGSSLVRSLAGGVAAFVLATAYTWWRIRSRQREAEQHEP
jgi:Flp pilus assembly protein TadB